MSHLREARAAAQGAHGRGANRRTGSGDCAGTLVPPMHPPQRPPCQGSPRLMTTPWPASWGHLRRVWSGPKRLLAGWNVRGGRDGPGMETTRRRRPNSRTAVLRNPERPVWARGWHAPSFHPTPTACSRGLPAPAGGVTVTPWAPGTSRPLQALAQPQCPPRPPSVACHCPTPHQGWNHSVTCPPGTRPGTKECGRQVGD